MACSSCGKSSVGKKMAASTGRQNYSPRRTTSGGAAQTVNNYGSPKVRLSFGRGR